MVAVALPATEVEGLLDKEPRWLAAINGPNSCVVSGLPAAIGQLEEQWHKAGVAYQRLATSHAFHSGMVEPILKAFEQEVRKVKLKAPVIPYISNVSGTWIKKEEATHPGYWVGHLRQTVQSIPILGMLIAVFLVIPLSAILWLILMFKAYQGEMFKLPIAGEMAEARIS